jgi:hypothetical protein
MRSSKGQARVSGAGAGVAFLLLQAETTPWNIHTTSNYVWIVKMFVDEAWQPHTTPSTRDSWLAAASAESSCAASPTLPRSAQSPHRSRPRLSLCSSSYIHTPTLLLYCQLTCDHLRLLRYTPIACLQEPHVARPA